MADIPRLELISTIGFAGAVPGGLLVHPDAQHLVYPLGNTVVIENLSTHQQKCLSGHTDNVSCLAVSKSGKYLASGQVTHMGFKADIIVWDYEKKELYCRLTLHKVKVEALAFSPNDKYVVSLGGQDDGTVVVWDLSKKEAVCGSPAAVQSSGTTYAITFANHSDDVFITGGNKTLRVWELDLANRKIKPTDCNMGQLKRIVKCIQVTENDETFFCGTTSGDILAVNVKTRLFAHYGPEKEKFSQGVLALKLMKTGDILVGAGDGTVAQVRLVDGSNNRSRNKTSYTYKKIKTAKLEGGITSIALRGHGHQFFVGTNMSQIYRFYYAEFTSELINTCHYGQVNDIAFPFGCCDLFATCAKNEIRVWNTATSKELLRITVPNMTCNAVDFMRDGHSIVSGWDDGKIRAFTPETGRPMYTINDCHQKGVTALATTSDSKHIISGGGEGDVRVWKIMPGTQSLIEPMKEHKGAVTCIKVKKDDTECATASIDGTCIIWDLETYKRKQIVFANTMFKAVCYHPDECQIITSGTDRKIAYWETFDGCQIRELEGSKSGSVEGMDVSPDKKLFVFGGADKLIKVFKYDEGAVTHVGSGHSGDITRIKICPNTKWIVSVSADGAILRWKYPEYRETTNGHI